MQAVASKGGMEAAGFADAPSEVAWLRVAKVPRSSEFSRRNLDKKKRQASKSDKSYGYPFHNSYNRLDDKGVREQFQAGNFKKVL